MPTGDIELDSAEVRAALERFVIENDELLALEERIGRFNIFDALGIVRTEIRHSNFLAWLLDPGESHGQGALFLKAVLMDLLRQSPPELRPFSPIQLDGAELTGVRVQREYRNIDILIECDEPRFVIAIENKVDSGEHSDQLDKYKKTVRDLFGDAPAQFVFLTRDGDEPSDDEWTTYTYRDIHNVLSRVRKTNEASIGDDVRTFLDHYLNLIGSRFMNDPTIDELCQTIYKNHRQAIELIMERVASPRTEAVQAIVGALADDRRWEVLNTTGQVVQLWPVVWDDLLPPIGTRQKYPLPKWMFLQINIGAKRCGSFVRITPTKDEGLRREIIERLASDPKEFGLKSLFKSLDKIGAKWAKLGQQRLLEWSEGEEPNSEQLIEALRHNLDKRHPKLAAVPDALRPIIAEWEKRQKGRA